MEFPATTFREVITYSLYPASKKWRGIMLYPPNRLSVCPSIRPSVLPSPLRFRTLPVFFFKLCMDIDIREVWFWIAKGINSFINNRVIVLDWCKNVFFRNIFRKNGWILIKFCICIDIYKTYVVSNACYFWSIFNSVMALDRSQNFVYALILTRCRFGWLNNIFRSFSTELWPLIDVEISFILNIL